jgi:hypothetical protein
VQDGAVPPTDWVAVLTTLTWAVSLAARPMGGNWDGSGGAYAPAGIMICPNAERAVKNTPALKAGTIVLLVIVYESSWTCLQTHAFGIRLRFSAE